MLILFAYVTVLCHSAPLIIGHRGMPSVFIENSLESFEGAAYLGADYVELDIQLDKNHEILVMHDNTLDRITDAYAFPEFNHLRRKDGQLYTYDLTRAQLGMLSLR